MDGFKLDKVKLNAADLVERKLKLFQIPLLDKGLELKLTVDRSLYITVDEEMILIAIQNLLSNAIKFAHPGSVVQVKVYSSLNQSVFISITNQGQPIPEHLVAKLFTYEMPVATDTRGERGTGLGLALTAFFVQLNGGSISLVPVEPGTTVFCMELPKAILN